MAKTQTKTFENAETQVSEQLPVNYDVRIHSLGTDGSTLANASVNINGVFAIRGIKVVAGTNGPFVSLPGYKTGSGEYKDICFPCTKEARQQFDSAVMDAYQQAISQVRDRNQAAAPNPFQEKTMEQSM